MFLNVHEQTLRGSVMTNGSSSQTVCGVLRGTREQKPKLRTGTKKRGGISKYPPMEKPGEATPWIPGEDPDEAPFLLNGAPVDFIVNSKFIPRRHIPWLERFRVNSP